MEDKLNYSWLTTDFTWIKDSIDLHSGLFIWVFHWDKIPHLGLSVNGAYYSVSFFGNQVGETVNKYFRLSTSKTIPTFCIQLKDIKMNSDFGSWFSEPMSNQETCLYPIKRALGFQNENINTLIDLIHVLENDNKIDSFLALQNTEILFLNAYNKADVLSTIENKMNHALRK